MRTTGKHTPSLLIMTLAVLSLAACACAAAGCQRSGLLTSGGANEATAAPSPSVPETNSPQPVADIKGTVDIKIDDEPKKQTGKVIVIDAGHQAKGDSSKEPIGPGATEKKPKVASGTSGITTKNPESKITLQVAKKLRKELKARGYTVVMVRTKQGVNISNSKRAKIANEANADLFIRLHCDGNGNSSIKGISTLIPKSNKWTKPIVKPSKEAGKKVHAAVVKSTGAKNRGLIQRGDLSGFNWCEVPTVLVEMGFMTNKSEDKNLSKASYQRKLVTGMANGIDSYLGE